ncbi:brain acid soluble protein 1 [Azospirillum argentinense]|uniref:brain acid soluble protein 1 n=1 Tax=Azospirillum argentinense TaxID=2970906 RepID=UPI001FFF4443|nr:brain acid soluble protein 1 [Azospirillum argentinense]
MWRRPSRPSPPPPGAAAGGFGEALGRALSSGQEMSGALGSAQQTVSTALALSAETAKGVKSDGLIAALASGQNVQQAVQALGGSGAAFNAALGQALADGRAPGSALAAARQTAETVQQNAQGSEVPVSPENKALADLANPPPAGEAAKDDAKGDGDKGDGEKAAEQVAEAPAEGKEGGKDEGGEKDDAKEEGAKEDGAKEDAKGEAADKSADASSAEGEAPKAAAKSSMGSEPALKPISFDAAGTAKSADTAAPSVTAPTPTTSAPPAAPAVTKALTSDPFAVAAQIQQQVARAIEVAAAALPAAVPPVAAPTLSAGFDAAAFAKALAIAEGTAAPAGFAVFHLIEAMFRPGEAGSSVIGVAVVANPDSPSGVWQYSVDGSVWLAVGTVGDGSALVLPDSALLRFLPAANWNGTTPSLGLRAVNGEWAEGFSGAEHRLFTLTGVGGTTPLSGDVAPLTLEVTPMNGAPVATGAQAVLAPIAEDSADPAGASVASLFGGLFSDPTDAVFGSAGNGFAGVAVVGNAATAAQGVWQYWTGSAWTAVGDVAEGTALTLAADAKLRFLPAADWNGTTPALTVRLIEDGGTPVVTGGRVDLTAGVGGSTVYSAGTIALTGTVTPVNDAPVATGTTTLLPAVAEDAVNPAGATVSTLFAHLFSDPADAVAGGSAANGFAGVAVIANGADTAQGQWQYWTGTAWTAVGTVSNGDALLLAAGTTLRFLPAADWNGVPPSLVVRLIDDSQGPVTSGERADVTGAGGDSRYSLGTIALNTAVNAVNDAPVATGTTATLPTIAEDTANPAGATVSALFGHLFSDAADAVSDGSTANGFAGVVVVGNAATTQGVWQYWTGTAWAGIGSASDANGLLLAANTALRFVPTANWNGTTPALTVRLVEDGGAPLVTGNRVDLTGGVGGSTVYSAGTIALTGTVTPINDAPVATGTTATLPTIAEDTVNPAGATVTSLFAHLFSDATDAVSGGSAANGFAGIAIVGNAATTQGVWQYWTGTGWTAVGAASDGNALLLAANTALRFVPAANWNGTTPALTVRLIDDSQGAVISGGRVALASVGGDSRYSAGTVALTTSVTPVNDAPVATGTAATLPTIAEDTANPTGATVASLFGPLFSDAADAVSGGSAADTLAGVVVVGNAATLAQGAWQYWTGAAWADIGAVSGGNGLLLAANTALRFVPAANWNGTTPALTVRLVDTSQGPIASGARVDATSVGGSTAYSAGTIALTGTVIPVNDAPVATGTTATLPTIAEDTVNPTGTSVTALFGHLFSDPADAVAGGSSANGFAGVAIVGNAATAGQGVWQYWSGFAWITVGAVAEGSALVVAASAMLRFLPAADWNGTTPALTVRLIEDGGAPVVTGGRVDLTSGVGGSTVYSADTVALTGTVTPVNDAPQITAGTTALATMKGVAVAVTGLSVSDVDAGALPMLVTLTAGHGTLTLASAGWDAVITGNGTDTVTIRATLATINGLLGAANGLLYTANSYTGADAIRIVVNDLGNGGAGGPLTATVTIGVTVVPPNASPVLIDTNLDVAVAAEALAAPTAGTVGFAVSKLVGLNGSGPANVIDTDAGAVVGIALTGTNESYGRWWFSTDNGATWSLVGAVNDSDSALLLRATDRLYFQPNAAVPATVNGALTIRAWDQTTGNAGFKAAVTLGDGSAFSTATDTVTLHPGVLIPNGTFDKGLTGWSYTGGATVDATGDGHEGTLTSAGGRTPTQLEDFLGLAHGSIATATGTIPSFGNAMKLATTVTVTKDTTLTFDWTFIFSDPGYHDFAFVSVNGVVTLLAKDASASGKFSVVIPANTTLSLGFGTSDTSDNSVNPILRIDNVKLTTVASDPIVLDMAGDGLALRSLTDGVLFDVSGDGVADRTGWVGKGNALLVRDDNHNGQIDDGRELVSEHFGKGFNSSLEALASLDSNHDGRLDAADQSFATLQVWQDADGDGVSQPGELRTLAEAGILSIASTATPTNTTLAGNHILGTTSMTMADGSGRVVAGVAFDAQATVAAQLHSQPLATSPAPAPQADHGRFDYTALLSSGLGLPDNVPVVQSSHDAHGGDWAMALHTADTHHATTHASTIVPVAENS